MPRTARRNGSPTCHPALMLPLQLCKDKQNGDLLAIKFIERGDKARCGGHVFRLAPESGSAAPARAVPHSRLPLRADHQVCGARDRQPPHAHPSACKSSGCVLRWALSGCARGAAPAQGPYRTARWLRGPQPQNSRLQGRGSMQAAPVRRPCTNRQCPTAAACMCQQSAPPSLPSTGGAVQGGLPHRALPRPCHGVCPGR